MQTKRALLYSCGHMSLSIFDGLQKFIVVYQHTDFGGIKLFVNRNEEVSNYHEKDTLFKIGKIIEEQKIEVVVMLHHQDCSCYASHEKQVKDLCDAKAIIKKHFKGIDIYVYISQSREMYPVDQETLEHDIAMTVNFGQAREFSRNLAQTGCL